MDTIDINYNHPVIDNPFCKFIVLHSNDTNLNDLRNLLTTYEDNDSHANIMIICQYFAKTKMFRDIYCLSVFLSY